MKLEREVAAPRGPLLCWIFKLASRIRGTRVVSHNQYSNIEHVGEELRNPSCSQGFLFFVVALNQTQGSDCLSAKQSFCSFTDVSRSLSSQSVSKPIYAERSRLHYISYSQLGKFKRTIDLPFKYFPLCCDESFGRHAQ